VAGHDLYAPPPRRRPPGEAGISRRSLLRLPRTPAGRGDTDYAAALDRVREGWERSGHEPLLRALEPVAAVVCELAGVEPGMQVLDVGAGDGNLALACLGRGAEVAACDVAPAMVQRGRARCHAARWRLADAQALPYPDGRFDAVLSTFGAVLAPRPRRTVRELVRVVGPGGVVALTAWVPRGLPGRLDELVEALAPLPEGVRSPADWGRQEVARKRLEEPLGDLELRLRTVTLRFADADAAFEALAGPAPLDEAGRDALRPDFDRLLASCNDSSSTAVELSARYLLAIGRTRGD
jgi:SAM-dependent methyltransferase